MGFLKRIFCNHQWVKVRYIYSYIDYNGYRVGVFECRCDICGKVRLRKYY